MRSRRPALAALLAVALAATPGGFLLAGCGDDEDEEQRAAPPAPRSEPEPARAEGGPKVETVATGLEAPWEIAFLPDGRALITERPGRVRLLSRSGELRREPLASVTVSAVEEGGLLGIAVDPDFEEHPFVYLYRTADSGNELVRYRLEGDELEEDATLVRGIRSSPIHDGGRVQVGPDDNLYFSTGDAGEDVLAQDRRSLNGKMLRLNPRQYRGSGGQPNFFTIGHRNPQGFDWQPRTDRLFASEHGPEGDDEINLLKRGANYGWPEAQGEEHGTFTAPLAVYDDSIAPSGATFVTRRGSEWTGDLLVAALVGEQIRRLSFDGSRVTRNEALFQGKYGRIRTVVEGPDGALYALTSNRDGRGSPSGDDDRLLRIVPPAS